MRDINGDGVVDKKDAIMWSLLVSIVFTFGFVVVTTISQSTVVDNTTNQASALTSMPLEVEVVVVPVEEATTTIVD